MSLLNFTLRILRSALIIVLAIIGMIAAGVFWPLLVLAIVCFPQTALQLYAKTGEIKVF